MKYLSFSLAVFSTFFCLTSGPSVYAGGRMSFSRTIESGPSLGYFSMGKERNVVPILEQHLVYRSNGNPNLNTELVRSQVLKAMNQYYQNRSLTKDSFGEVVLDSNALAEFAVGFSGRVFLSGEAFASYKSNVMQYVTSSNGFSVRVKLPDGSYRTINIESVNYSEKLKLEDHFILSLNEGMRSIRDEIWPDGESNGQFITVESIIEN